MLTLMCLLDSINVPSRPREAQILSTNLVSTIDIDGWLLYRSVDRSPEIDTEPHRTLSSTFRVLSYSSVMVPYKKDHEGARSDVDKQWVKRSLQKDRTALVHIPFMFT